MKGLFMKLLTSLLLLSTLAVAGIYDYNYSPLEKGKVAPQEKNPFMYGDFDKVMRFKPLYFKDGKLSKETDQELEKIVDIVNKYKDENRTVALTILSYTAATTDDPNENVIRSKTYANTIINWFSDDLDENKSRELSKDFGTTVEQLLMDKNISKSIMYLESRGGKDIAFSDETAEGRELSNRVLVTFYLSTPPKLDIDSDQDGVFDQNDNCPKTPLGVEVDTHGCPFDTDGDGVYDYLDKCPDTPKGIEVDNIGCPLDSDGDGVYDYLDQCPGTPENFKVDTVGCPLSKKLMVTFASWSYAIRPETYPEVVDFAKFLRESPQYKAEIVGHTDSIGKKYGNMKLSQQRANAVKEALVKEGIAASRITTRGRGELEPIADNRTKEGRQKNRRIEVKLHY